MNIKQLEKATKIIEQVKALDKEIIEIDRQAMLVANGETKIELKLGITDLAKKREEEEKVAFDEDGSIVKKGGGLRLTWDMGIMGGLMGYATEVKKEKENKDWYAAEISENAALQLFGILLYEKQAKRQQLLSKLEKIGVEL